MKFGRHNGAPYERVAAEDGQYCAWVLRENRQNSQLNRTMRSFAVYLRKQHGGLTTFGKHPGKRFDDFMMEDPMKELHEYIVEQQRIAADDENRKRRRDDEADGKCIMCIERARTSAFAPCGHCVCC